MMTSNIQHDDELKETASFFNQPSSLIQTNRQPSRVSRQVIVKAQVQTNIKPKV